MHLQRAPGAFQWNLNTIVSGVTLLMVLLGGAGTLVGGGYAINDVRRDIQAHDAWIAEHEAAIRERRDENQSAIASMRTSLVSVDDRLDAEEAMSTRLSDRQAAADARGAELAAAVRDLQTAINDMSGDLKVIRAWIDEQRRQERQP